MKLVINNMSKKFDVYWWKDKSRKNLNRIYRLWLDIIIRIDTFFFYVQKESKISLHFTL